MSAAMAGNPLTDPRWPGDLADAVENVVGTIRDRATTPVVKITRGIVYGLLASFVAITALVCVIIGMTRALQILLDLGLTEAQAVYVSYLIMGGILSLLGWLVLVMRHTGDE
jgi:hypothetical protein